jgi:polar amino acid transport system substrate-binding protein
MNHRRRAAAIVAVVAVAAVVWPALGTSRTTGDPSTDKLAQVLARGTLVLFTDPAYPPQSFAAKGGKRKAGTKCAPNQLTAPEIAGYDADTGKLVAKALGVEPCFVTPSWTEVIGGNWGDRWDLAYGSGAVDFDRMSVLYMTQPYYSTPTNFFVRATSKVRRASDLAGKRVGACTGCTMEKYLRGTLHLPGTKIGHLVRNPKVVTFQTEVPGLQAVAAGKLDGFLCSEPVGRGAIKEGLKLRELPQVAYDSFKTGYVDKGSGLTSSAFVNRVDEIVRHLQADGALRKLSLKYFGVDYATRAAAFKLAVIGQKVK